MIKKDGEAVYNKVRIKVVKNKVIPPIIYGHGIDTKGDLVQVN